MKIKLAILSSHPIQYNAPMFAMLARSEKLAVKLFYTWSQSRESLFDKDFGKTIQWDIPLLEGYDHTFVANISANPGPGSYKGIVCPSLIQEIKAWGADALLVYGWNYHAHYHAMKYFKGRIPVFFRGDSTLLDESAGVKQLIRRTLLRFVYRSADYAFYVGENNRQYYLKHGFGKDQLFFAPHAIDNHRFSDPEGAMRKEAQKWRGELGIGEQDIAVLFAGKFEPKKDPLVLIRAALLLNKQGVHYIFTGNGALEEKMKELAGNHPMFHFLPFQNQSRMPAVYNLGDVLALPSQGPGETWGLAVNEAMACGKAILVSDKCGCAIDLVIPGKNGYIMAAGNVEQCAELLGHLTSSKERVQEMGAFSAKHITKWSFEAICRSFEEHIPGKITRRKQ